jgi:HlyD family secretion protein
MSRQRLIVTVLAVGVLVAGGLFWWATHPRKTHDLLTLSGNVDLRQVELSFNDSDRIKDVLVQEGDRVVPGQVLARLDVSRLEPELDQAEAQSAAQAALVARLHAGNRPQEIAEAKANLAAAAADAVNAEGVYRRADSLWSASAGQAAISRQDVDNAKAAMDAGQAKLMAQRQAYDLAVIGPRKEDIHQAEAQLRATRAQFAVLKRQRIDADLVAPVAGVVRSRLLEPGEMASPQRPVFTISVTTPKWVRAYVNELDLVRLHPGMAAAVSVDGFPGRSFRAWIGFISSVAEFTPKTVQTNELRTSLVYEVRVFVNDPADDLRLGMPATVQIHLAGAPGPGR